LRFIHTADWHLGRLFHAQHLTEDQAYILDQFVDLVRDARPDAVIVAGDIYDRAVPPPDAVRLLDDVLSRLVRGLEVPVVLIAGNHDSPDRLGFGAQLLAPQRLHLFGVPAAAPGRVGFADEHGPIHLYALPYAEPPVVRQLLEDDDVQGHDAALRAQLARVRARHPEGERSIVVAHAFVAGGSESDSERPLSVGGAGTVDADAFAGFDYVALGHLHRPQWIDAARGESQISEQTTLDLDAPAPSARGGGPRDPRTSGRIRYSGSLLKYSFSEAEHAKSISIVELDAAGACTIEEVRLTPRRDVRRIEGDLAELIERGREDTRRDDYILATLTDRGALLDPIGKLREVYPNVLQLERLLLTPAGQSGAPRADHRQLGEEVLFRGFMEEVTGEPLSDAQEVAFARVVEQLRQTEREVSV
jgi:exonuclease SbcD